MPESPSTPPTPPHAPDAHDPGQTNGAGTHSGSNGGAGEGGKPSKPKVRITLQPAASAGASGSSPAGSPVPPSGGDGAAVPNAAGSGGAGASGGGGAGSGGGSGGAGGLGDPGNISEIEIERELHDSYLTYAMSTIMDRALPDVRDGLKPSQRRILVAMNDLNLRPGKKHIKCAKITGDTSGNYHPHGEAVIYPTLVGMAQKWRMRATLIDPQGNFGSIDGDPPAAQRYTEARMAHPAVDMLDDLKLDTVDFQPNYDDRLMEPTVLPAKFPNLLVNGSVGIAVGMATSLAPHNPVEVLDSVIRVVEKPEIGLGELMTDVADAEGNVTRRGIRGPDFPTGGIILGRGGIIDAYSTGRGKVTVRGKVHQEEVPGSKDRQQLVIDEIPYGVNQTSLIEKIKEAVEDGRITEVSDARNESGREAQSRVVIELKRSADPAVVENQIYQFTPLQQSYSINNIALVNRQPRTLSLIELIKHYIDHRTVVIRRRTSYLLNEARKRAHILEGMIYAVCDIDEVIKLIRSSQTRNEAIEKLMLKRFRISEDHPFASQIPARLMEQVRKTRSPSGDWGMLLSRIQAETICNMRLSQLVGLEIERLVDDYRQIVAQIEDYEDILARPERVKAMIIADCEEMRARFTSTKVVNNPKRFIGDRVTEIQDGGDGSAIDIGALIQVEDMAVTISHQGYAKRVALSTYRQQARGGKGIIGGAAKDEDFIEHMFVASTHDDLLCFTNTGRVFRIKVYELPEMPRTSKGRPFVNLIELKEGEKVRAFLAIKDFEQSSKYLTFLSRQGIVKRTPLKDYRNVNRSGLIAVGLKEGDSILDVLETTGTDDLLLATAGGMSIRFNEDEARAMGRAAAGVKAIELEEGDEVIGAIAIHMTGDAEDKKFLTTINPKTCLLTISENGYGKRTPVDEYRVQPESGPTRSQSRGGKGRVDIDASQRNGRSVAALGVLEGDDVVVTTRTGMTVRMPVNEIRETGRGTQGVRVVKLDEADQVVAAARVLANE
ncbi:MAG: DNA gyrase subunit A [Phycisphaerales bacterium]|nr:DNA gyrase subunit A [Phycisphaerales bacterium]